MRRKQQLANFEQRAHVVAVVLRALAQPALVVGARLGRFDRQLRRDVAVDVLDLDLDDLRAETLERCERCLHRIAHRRLNVVEKVARHDADAQSAHAIEQSGAVVGARPRGGRRILWVMARHRAEHQCAVFDRARHRPGGVHAPGERDDAVVADATVGRPDAGDAVDRRGQADRAARVGADGTETTARRDRHTRAPAGAGRETLDVPWVAHGAVVRIGRGAPPRELVHVGLADEDRTRPAQAFCNAGVGIGQPVAEHLAARSRARAAQRDVVFQRDRDAVQRPQVVTGGDHDFGGFRDLQRLFLEDRDVGAQHVVGRAYAQHRRSHQIDRRDLTRADLACGLREAQVEEFVVAAHGESSALSAACVSTVMGSSA